MGTHRIIAALIICCGIAGCNDYTASTTDGTTQGFSRCMSEGKKQQLAERIVRAFCIAKNERVTGLWLTGNASYAFSYGDRATFSFSGSVKNPSPDVIITSYEVRISRKDSEQPEVHKIYDQWIPPGGSSGFEISASDLKLKPNLEQTDQKLWTWHIEAVRGIRIQI